MTTRWLNRTRLTPSKVSFIPMRTIRISLFRRHLLPAVAWVLLAPAALLVQAQPVASPDVPDELTLKTALTFALENNFSIRQAREQIREQEGLIVEVKALALPNASVDSSYTKADREFLKDQGSSGGSDDNQNWSIGLNVRQTLYSGGGVRAALDAQRIIRESALLGLQATINDALLQVRTRFYAVLLAREQIKVEEQNIQLLQEQLETARNRFNAGASSNFEVLRAEVALANAQPALIRVRNNLRISIDQLRQSLGYMNPRTESVRKIPNFVGTLDITPVSYELLQVIDTARTSRPELLQLEKIEKAREANIVIQRAGYYPDLALSGGYTLRKSGLSNRFRESLDGWNVGLSSSWAVFDGRATKGKVMQARSQLEQARLQTEENTLAVEVEARTAHSSWQEAAELAAAAVKVVAQADEALRLASARYAAGTATQLDVLQARVDLTTARNNQLQANYSYNVAVATLKRAMGQADTYATQP